MITPLLHPPITLEIHICDQRRSYLVTFEGPDAQRMAIEFVKTRSATHAIWELQDQPDRWIDHRHGELLELLYPTCPHGLSESNCYGPQHYYFDEEEQARGHRNGW